MKYAAVFATILIVWIAVILIALTLSSSSETFQLYIASMVMTVVLFIIGFGKVQ